MTAEVEGLGHEGGTLHNFLQRSKEPSGSLLKHKRIRIEESLNHSMAPIFEVLLPRRPVSCQGKPNSKEEWKSFVYGRAFREWNQTPIRDCWLRFTVVYLCESDPADINNIIKPIQDAMNSLVYADDSLVCDVTGHMRLLSDPIDIVGLPTLLAEAVIKGFECVYVQVSNSNELNQELFR